MITNTVYIYIYIQPCLTAESTKSVDLYFDQRSLYPQIVVESIIVVGKSVARDSSREISETARREEVRKRINRLR